MGMVFKDLTGCGFELSAIDVSSQSDESINILKHQVRQFLNGLPPGLSIQFVQQITNGNDWLIDSHGDVRRENLTEFQNEILESRLKKFRELDDQGEIPRQRLFIFIRKKFESFPKNKWDLLKFWKPRVISLHEGHLKSEIQKFEQVLENVVTQLSNLRYATSLSTEPCPHLSTMESRPLSEGEINGTMFTTNLLTDSVIELIIFIGNLPQGDLA
jgi:hypothetical protein